MYKVEIFQDDVWIRASMHSDLVDAERQVIIYKESNGIFDEDIRVIDLDAIIEE